MRSCGGEREQLGVQLGEAHREGVPKTQLGGDGVKGRVKDLGEAA